MAAQVLPVSGTAGGSFLDSPVFNGRRTKPPPSGFDLRDAANNNINNTRNSNYNNSISIKNNNPAVQTLNFDSSDLEDSTLPVCTTYTFHCHVDTPDSGCSGLTPSTPALKTPESDMSVCGTPCESTAGSGSGNRKRKTVTIDESQTSVVMISPDDLFNTYSRAQSQIEAEEEEGFELREPEPWVDEDHERCEFESLLATDPGRLILDSETGWPLRRSQSLESRDNPFLPGGDLSREAEDLLSRATIIRDHFYLNEEERKTLREQQQLQQQQQQQQHEQSQQVPVQKQPRTTKHVQIVDHLDGSVHDTTNGHAAASPEAVEERISPQAVSATAAAAPANGGDASTHPPKENGNAGDSAPGATDSVHVSIPDGEGQTPHTGTPGDPQETDKKRRNKCCAVM